MTSRPSNGISDVSDASLVSSESDIVVNSSIRTTSSGDLGSVDRPSRGSFASTSTTSGVNSGRDRVRFAVFSPLVRVDTVDSSVVTNDSVFEDSCDSTPHQSERPLTRAERKSSQSGRASVGPPPDSRMWPYDPEKSRIDLRYLRSTDLPFNSYVHMPPPLRAGRNKAPEYEEGPDRCCRRVYKRDRR